MRVAAGLILASAMSVALTGAAWSQTPAAKPAAATSRTGRTAAAPAPPRPAPQPLPPPPRHQPARLQQPERARRRPHRRDRHHRRPRLRLRAFQAARFPARQGGRADLRRRPMAAQHARRAQGARRRMHHRHLLLDRQARDLLSGDPEAGLRGRPHRRLAHLVARQPQQQEADRGRSARKRSRRASAP